MDSTASPPPYRRSEPPSRTKSVSRLAQCEKIPRLSLDLITSSSPFPKRTPPSLKSSGSLPLYELLFLSPLPIPRRTKTRLADRLEMTDEPISEQPGPRRRCKSSRAPRMGCASPRNTQRSRRRSEVEIREDKNLGEEIVKPRKRRSKKETLSLVPCVPSPTSSTMDDDDDDGGRLDRIGQLMNDLNMWRDVQTKKTYSATLSTPTSPIYSSMLAFQSSTRTPVLFPAIHLSPTPSPARNRSHHPLFPLNTQPRLCLCSPHYHDLLCRSPFKLCAAELRFDPKVHDDFSSLDVPLSLPYS